MLSNSIVRSLCNTGTHNIRRCRISRNYVSTFPAEKFENRVELTTSENNQIVHVTLNRPDKLNALDMPMFEGLSAAIHHIKASKSARFVIISGKGTGFCSGLDVKSMMSNPAHGSKLLKKPAGTEITNLAQDLGYLWRQLPMPVVACLHGTCYGGALQIALGADFRFSTSDCKFSVMEGKWGIIPDMSASITMRELVRMDVIKELTMTARVFLGEEAQQLGLVTRCVSDPQEEALKLARELLQRSPDAIAAAKKLFQDTWLLPAAVKKLNNESTTSTP